LCEFMNFFFNLNYTHSPLVSARTYSPANTSYKCFRPENLWAFTMQHIQMPSFSMLAIEKNYVQPVENRSPSQITKH
jgi:hypothetical protein